MADRLLMIHYGRKVLYGTVEEVRRRFAVNAVEVEGTGDWSTVPGIVNVERAENGREYRLMLDTGVTVDNVMRALADSPDHHVRRFEEAIPSLNEIFIQVVREQGGQINGGA
jgi:ABC-2 type transport system ATP-binding protein